ncbi:hypothetical protein RhiirA4_479102 [Rhizophagus irregularis]|uniref:Uncharacterized protein n=1 Tax=Rhizophagus irregularis TaxID=588596 RepID=A0A2I1HFW7_9GLOM|nr:hypothetical protein RhiirA4_479102 [Rhizophagus irregularis]
MVEVEKIYDNLSIISSYETPQQCAICVKDTLQTLIAEGYRSFYHVFCLFGSFEQGVTKTCYNIWAGRKLPSVISYHRPSVHKSQMAICFKCWKLVKITEVKPRKIYFDGWHRWDYKIKSEDLMKNHWNNSCFKAETATIAKNTIPSDPNFEPACIPPARQEMISLTSYQSSNCRSNTSEIFISSLYAKQNNLLPSINHLNRPVLKLEDGTEITIV